MVRKSGNPRNLLLSCVLHNLCTQSINAGPHDHHETGNKQDSRVVHEAAPLVTGTKG